jgi:hypothetical protein
VFGSARKNAAWARQSIEDGQVVSILRSPGQIIVLQKLCGRRFVRRILLQLLMQMP